MNLRLLLFIVAVNAALAAPAARAQTAADANEGSALSRDPGPGVATFSWWGRAGRTYFLQQSDDLLHWNYLPVVESGSEQGIQWSFTSSQPQCFVRLEYTDLSTADPFGDDFDGDRVSNYAEVLQNTDPLSAALDANGLPLDWERFYSLPVGINANAPAPRNDGLTYVQAFQQGVNPMDFYNGNPPNVALVSGDQQLGPKGGFVSAPLIVSVTDANNVPLVGAPVTFSVGLGGGQVQPSSIGTPGLSITVLTDTKGQARAFFKLPDIANNTCQIVAVPGSGGSPSQALFTETSDGGGGSYDSPFDATNVAATANADGSIDVTWTNNADPADPEPTDLMYQDRNGAWQALISVPAGVSSYHVPAP